MANRLRSFLNPIIIIGVTLTALFLGIYTFSSTLFIKFSSFELISLVGFFMGVAVTLLFYFIQKFNNTQEVMLNTLERQQESLKNVFTLGKELSEDSELAGIIGRIVADYQVGKTRNSPLFKQKRFDSLQKSKGTLHNLAACELSSEHFVRLNTSLISIDQLLIYV